MPRPKPKKKPVTKRSTKPPRERSPVDWAEVFDRIASGEPLAHLVSTKAGWPEAHKLMQEIAASPELLERYKVARRAALMMESEELLTVAEDGRNDFTDTEKVQRSKLRIDTTIRLLQAFDPGTYGTKIDLSNKDGTLASAWANALGAVNAEKKENATKH